MQLIKFVTVNQSVKIPPRLGFQTPDSGRTLHSSNSGGRYGEPDPGPQRALQYPSARSGQEEPVPLTRLVTTEEREQHEETGNRKPDCEFVHFFQTPQ